MADIWTKDNEVSVQKEYSFSLLMLLYSSKVNQQ